MTGRLRRERSGLLRLWSLQPLGVWQELQKRGVLDADPNLSFDDTDLREWFAPAYEWMRAQMARRIPGYSGGHLWWAYEHKPDLRRERFTSASPLGRMVRLELAIPTERVLLSAYGDWHFALNRWYLPPATSPTGSEQEARAWAGELAAEGLNPAAVVLPEPFHSRREGSWERIFEVDQLRDSNTIQATFERLVMAEVVSVTEYATVRR